MQKLTQDRRLGRTEREEPSPKFCRAYAKSLWALLLAGTTMLSACGGGGSSNNTVLQNPVPLSGNWQFAVSNPPDQSFAGGIQGGFLLQNGGSAKGAALYSVSVPSQSGGGQTVCSSGSASVSATIDGQTVTLTAAAGTQTFAFTGVLSIDGTAMAGTYSSTAGTAADGLPCGTAQTGLQWSAALVPLLMGPVQGSFHSTGGAAGLNNQDFLVSGVLSQGANTGAGSVTVTGSLGFADPITLLSDYPCLVTANVNGTISGNTVTLQMTGPGGSNLGQIGGSPGSGLGTVTFDSTLHGLVLHSLVGTAYALSTSTCPGSGTLTSPGDSGNLCLAFNGAAACQQPFTLAPAALTFPAQSLGSTSAVQKITLTNTSGAILTGLTWTFTNNSGAANFKVTADTCDVPGDPLGSTFSLNLLQSCVISVSFTPQASCASGTQSGQCSSSMTASLTLMSPVTADNDTAFTVPITGTGVSSNAVAISKLNFAVDGVSKTSLSRLHSFTDRSGLSVQTLLGSGDRSFQDVEQHAETD